MAFGNSTTSFDALLKEYYDEDGVTNAIFTENRFLGIVPKFEGSVGRHFVHSIVYGAGQGGSANFTTAQTMAGLSGENAVQMLISLNEEHRVANVSSQTIAESSNDKGAFLKAVTLIGDNQLQEFANSKSVQLYRGTDGSRGQIASTTTIASSTLVLANAGDAKNFEVGMQLDLAAAQSSGGTRAYGTNSHGLYVVKVDYVGGTLTVGTTPTPNGTQCNISDAADGIPTAATGDYIYRTGDRNLVTAGLESWIPQGGPASNDSFFNVNRSINPVRLAGNWLDGTGGEITEVLETAAAQVYDFGGSLTHFLMPHKKVGDLSKSLGAKMQIIDEPSTAQVGYKAITVMGPGGPIMVLGDRTCPPNRVFGINKNAWALNSVGKAVHVWDEDGKIWLRSSTQSGMEIRFYSFSQLVCRSPRDNINIKISP